MSQEEYAELIAGSEVVHFPTQEEIELRQQKIVEEAASRAAETLQKQAVAIAALCPKCEIERVCDKSILAECERVETGEREYSDIAAKQYALWRDEVYEMECKAECERVAAAIQKQEEIDALKTADIKSIGESGSDKTDEHENPKSLSKKAANRKRKKGGK